MFSVDSYNFPIVSFVEMIEEAEQDKTMYCSEWFVAVCSVAYEKAIDNVTHVGKALDWPMEHTCRSVSVTNAEYHLSLNEYILEDCVWLYIDKNVHEIIKAKYWRPPLTKELGEDKYVCVCLRH